MGARGERHRRRRGEETRAARPGAPSPREEAESGTNAGLTPSGAGAARRGVLSVSQWGWGGRIFLCFSVFFFSASLAGELRLDVLEDPQHVRRLRVVVAADQGHDSQEVLEPLALLRVVRDQCGTRVAPRRLVDDLRDLVALREGPLEARQGLAHGLVGTKPTKAHPGVVDVLDDEGPRRARDDARIFDSCRASSNVLGTAAYGSATGLLEALVNCCHRPIVSKVSSSRATRSPRTPRGAARNIALAVPR